MENKDLMITDESDSGGTHYVLHSANVVSNRKGHAIIYAHFNKNWAATNT